jgi:Bax protein
MIDEIDRIPIILVLAQAIHESDWGKSRFAREGNNLFGIRALEGEDFIRARSGKKVKKYFTWCESVNDYMELLLTSYHYKEFQKELENQWFNDEIDVNKLVDTLDLYAEDVYYKDKIKDVIKSVERRLE